MVTGSKEILLKEALQAAKLTSKQENNFCLFIHTLWFHPKIWRALACYNLLKIG